jgi:hypothetical protein
VDWLKDILLDIKTGHSYQTQSLNKPALLAITLSRYAMGESRLIPYSFYDETLKKLSEILNKELKASYPFVRLVNDDVWEIDSELDLDFNSSGDVSRVQLLNNKVYGGLKKNLYDEIINKKYFIRYLINEILEKYFIDEDIKMFIKFLETLDQEKIKDDTMLQKINFISYLNSLHNFNANGSNALAESQALSQYFPDLYVPFPIIDSIVNVLKHHEPCVVVLTGHAGDGKSTIALDVLKKLRGHSEVQPLSHALKEIEEVAVANKTVLIVKDMSELSAKQRLDRLNQAVSGTSSSLVVSNTGPLLDSLAQLAKAKQIDREIENDILDKLDLAYEGNANLQHHELSQSAQDFGKKIIILNLTRLDNVNLGVEVLEKIVSHPAWQECDACVAKQNCPIRANKRALADAMPHVLERVRWVYRRLTAYEQRLTLRQMVAHLAISVTGGNNCQPIKANINSTPSLFEPIKEDYEGLDTLVFSEIFFGFKQGKAWAQLDALRAIKLMRRITFGAPVAVDLERFLLSSEGLERLHLPKTLHHLANQWITQGLGANAVYWRFAMRRMVYMFTPQLPELPSSSVFFTRFLHSPRIVDFDSWQQNSGFKTKNTNKDCHHILRVLLEVYSGFSAVQFVRNVDSLYLTLRRPDKTIVQPTQLVVATLSFRDFELRYNTQKKMPELRYKHLKDTALLLTLPLLDFIQLRSEGDLGSHLAPIHLAQLERFRSDLFNAAHSQNDDDITLLQAGIDGTVKSHQFLLSEDKQRLERNE